MDLPDLPEKQTLVLNGASPLLQKLLSCADEEKKRAAAGQIYGLALLSQRRLTAEELKKFLSESFKTLELGL
jgi:HSP90 family molecular chaperone